MRLGNALAAVLMIGALLYGGALSFRAGRPAPLPAERIVLISVDTLRADRLGAYGHDRPTSPTIDTLATRGTRFAHCVATSPWTPPSHVSLMTGLYPSRTGIRSVPDRLRPGVRTLAEELQARGFRTAAVLSSDIALPCPRCTAGFEEVEEIPWRGDTDGTGPVVANRGDAVTEAAVRWLGARTGEDRFFLFVHYYDVHSDYLPRPTLAFRVGADPDDLEPGSTKFLIDGRDTGRVAADDLEQMQRLYDAEVLQLDGVLERLFRFLQARGLWQDTLVVLTADHGEEFFEHGGLLHGRTLYEEMLHVPLIMRGPGVPRGRVVPRVVSLVDVAPTILALAGVPPAPGLDGRSLVPLLQGQNGGWVERVAGEADQKRLKRMVRVGRLKLIEDRERGYELYDLARDPDERRNLARARPRETAMLAQELSAVLGSDGAAPSPELHSDVRERLRMLGYVD